MISVYIPRLFLHNQFTEIFVVASLGLHNENTLDFRCKQKQRIM